jgi:diguanylate cyclase (GGDEF)-like protein
MEVNVLSLISSGLVVIGTLILASSLFTVRKIIQRLPLGGSRHSWYAMAGLIVLFVVGYLSYVVIFWGKQFTTIDLVVPGVFFFGACFVWLSTFLALHTAMDVMRITILEHETVTDPLTGVFNRRFMDRRLVEEVSKARRHKFELAVLMLDLDHFKEINDVHGHQTGDQLLKDIGDLLGRELRDSDVLARYGGEEFVVIAPNTAPVDATVLAERLRHRIEGHKSMPEEDNFKLRVTVSIGVANYGGDIIDEESLIRIADKNLYLAKGSGRNRVVPQPSNT